MKAATTIARGKYFIQFNYPSASRVLLLKAQAVTHLPVSLGRDALAVGTVAFRGFCAAAAVAAADTAAAFSGPSK